MLVKDKIFAFILLQFEAIISMILTSGGITVTLVDVILFSSLISGERGCEYFSVSCSFSIIISVSFGEIARSTSPNLELVNDELLRS